VAAAAASLGVDAEVVPSVSAAVGRALAAAGENDFILVTGSLYVVGEARGVLLGT
jgi:folylpolyglutamate synthase/dihydropteroate synthase